MEQMRKAVDGYLACQPVGFKTPKDKPDFTSLPEFPYSLDPLQLTRKEMGQYAAQAREIGINYIGSCLWIGRFACARDGERPGQVAA